MYYLCPNRPKPEPMSKKDKLIARLLSHPKDFTFDELKALLMSLGYSEIQGAGSRVCFSTEGHKIKLHKPHPGNLVKSYMLDLVIGELVRRGLINN
jgi:hypothetical protein